MQKQRGRPLGPITRGVQIHAASREMNRLLSFGGELGRRQAGRIAAEIAQDAEAIRVYCERPKAA